MATHGGERDGRIPRGQESLRAADQDRQHVADWLYAALNEGRLSLNEYDDRVRSAYGARTYAELNALLDDLPPAVQSAALAVPPRQPPTPSAPTGRPPSKLPMALMVLWTIWGCVVAVNLVVWMLVSVTTGDLIYPWPVWVAGPSGAALLGVTVGVQAIRRSRAQP
jgi:hypothetical protein